MAYLKPPWFVRKIFNRVAMATGVGNSQTLTVIKRVSKQPQQIPVVVPEVDVPVLTIWGAEDRIIAPGADAQIVEGAGHSPHMEAAGEVNRLIDRFLTAAV